MRKLKVLIVLLLFFSAVSSILSQEKRKIEINAQSIVARVDSILRYPNGKITGRMKHILPNGNTYQIDLRASITKEDFLFVFKTSARGDQVKVLYNMNGEEIWVYDIHALQLFHKMGIDKYDNILRTNYSYIDLSNADLQSNYRAIYIGSGKIKGKSIYKLRLDPIFKGSEYGKLVIYVTRDKYIPLRIDYHDRDKAIFKFMTINKVIEKGNIIIPIRYEMMDIRKGTLTILWFLDFEREVTFNKQIFRHEKLGE